MSLALPARMPGWIAKEPSAPISRIKRDGIEYGGAVGAGAITGAVLGGPAGALAGTIIGAGAVTAHLLVSHPQATLEPGTVLLFTLTQPLNLVAQTKRPAAEWALDQFENKTKTLLRQGFLHKRT